jgi:hypothetical protein
MIFSDLPSPAEASSEMNEFVPGLRAGRKPVPTFRIRLCVEDQPWRAAIVAHSPRGATAVAGRAFRDRWCLALTNGSA